eukprot:6598488-Pyramimonas_sp.AAC.1
MSLVATGQYGVWIFLGHSGLCPRGYPSIGPVRPSGPPGAGKPTARDCVGGRGGSLPSTASPLGWPHVLLRSS